MGKIPQGILGHLSQSVGVVTGASVKGVPTLRRKSSGGVNPRTAQQVEVRTAFGEASEYCRVNKEAILAQENFKEKKGLTIWNQMIRWYQNGGRLIPTGPAWELDESGDVLRLLYSNFDVIESNGEYMAVVDFGLLPEGVILGSLTSSCYIRTPDNMSYGIGRTFTDLGDNKYAIKVSAARITSKTLALYTGGQFECTVRLSEESQWHPDEYVTITIQTGNCASCLGSFQIVERMPKMFDCDEGLEFEQFERSAAYVISVNPASYETVPAFYFSCDNLDVARDLYEKFKKMISWKGDGSVATTPFVSSVKLSGTDVAVYFSRAMDPSKAVKWSRALWSSAEAGYAVDGYFATKETYVGWKWENYVSDDAPDADAKAILSNWLGCFSSALKEIGEHNYGRSKSYCFAYNDNDKLKLDLTEWDGGPEYLQEGTFRFCIIRKSDSVIMQEAFVPEPHNASERMADTGLSFSSMRSQYRTTAYYACVDFWGSDGGSEIRKGFFRFIDCTEFFPAASSGEKVQKRTRKVAESENNA